jgi:hypothetical protein
MCFLDKSLVIDGKRNKIVRTREERPMSSYSFRLFLVLLGPIYKQNISAKSKVETADSMQYNHLESLESSRTIAEALGCNF